MNAARAAAEVRDWSTLSSTGPPCFWSLHRRCGCIRTAAVTTQCADGSLDAVQPYVFGPIALLLTSWGDRRPPRLTLVSFQLVQPRRRRFVAGRTCKHSEQPLAAIPLGQRLWLLAAPARPCHVVPRLLWLVGHPLSVEKVTGDRPRPDGGQPHSPVVVNGAVSGPTSEAVRQAQVIKKPKKKLAKTKIFK